VGHKIKKFFYFEKERKKKLKFQILRKLIWTVSFILGES